MEKVNETVKYDQGKPDFTLIPQEALLEVAKVFTHGAGKYGVFNYSHGTNYRRYIAACFRHVNSWLKGEDIDESGTNHLSNAIASLMMVLDNQLTGKGVDDRNKVYNKNKNCNMSDGDFQVPVQYEHLDNKAIDALWEISKLYPNDAEFGAKVRQMGARGNRVAVVKTEFKGLEKEMD